MSTSNMSSTIMANPSVRLTRRQDSQKVRFSQTEQPPPDSLHNRYYHPEIKYDRKAVTDFVQRHTSFRYSNPLVPKPLNIKRSNTTVQPRETRRPPVSFKPRHVNRLSLEDSLAKPLPRSPPQELLSPEFRHSYHSPSDIGRCGIDFGKPIMLHRSGTMDSLAGGHYYGSGQDQNANMQTSSSMNNLNSNRQYENPDMGEPSGPRLSNSNANASPAPSQTRSTPGSVPVGTPQGSSAHLSGLMCNVHRTTGNEPPPLVGATTTILGDKLYVFGGRVLAKNRPAPLTSDLYELDLIRRHWTKLETGGDVPPPRYFHSMCALGDTKMVCYGGMSPAPSQPVNAEQQQGEVTVMSDIYIYDVSTRSWTFIPAQDVPQGRYAHCACILPSSANFSSTKAPLSALQHNPSSNNPNEGRIGINIDGSGGAQMVIVGGQDGANHYIEQISVFNLRSLKWTSTQPFGKSCGAYRSVAAPLSAAVTARTGKTLQNGPQRNDGSISQEAREPGSSMLIYSNYNFLDVKLELQIRSPDGTLTEWPMAGTYSPPGLRFPNGGVIDTYFVVSGTYLTSSKQEYALWALDLRNLTWSRIDAGGSVFSQGSWNRGVLWNRRNTFVILGNRKRSLVDDYNHRRINFSNVCMVELEAFGFYDNPRKISPLSGFISASSPHAQPGLSLARKAGYTAGGRFHTRASEDLGEKALAMRELADMDIICISGERIAANSRIVGRRWGPYFVQLLRDGTASQDGDTATLRSNPMRASALTITGNSRDLSSIATLTGPAGGLTAANAGGNIDGNGDDVNGEADDGNPALMNATPSPKSLPPNSRPRCLYLPHTYLTVQALLHFLYTSSLPPTTSPLCSPQILCSLLQIARPYRVDGLLEAVVERLHSLLDSRNAAAVFNATAMAAGGGRGIDGSLNPNFHVDYMDPIRSPVSTSDFSLGGTTANESFTADIESRTGSLSLGSGMQQSSGSLGDTSASTSLSGSDWGSDAGSEHDGTVWTGELSSVIGLQKRGLRGLMEGRRMRERTGTGNATTLAGPSGQQYNMQGGPRVGLGIAGSLN